MDETVKYWEFSPIIFISLLCCVSSDFRDIKEINFGSAIVKVQLHHRQNSTNYLSTYVIKNGIVVDSSEWELPYPVFYFEIGDINGNGIADIAVGVIKTTRYDKKKGKRIFLFQLQEGNIVPMWLGSQVSQPLFDFSLFKYTNKNFIRTIEYEQDGSFLVAEYEWKGFGLGFVRYIIRNSSLSQVRKVFRKAI